MTEEKYVWKGTGNLCVPESHEIVTTGKEFEMGHNELSHSGIQVMIKEGLIVKAGDYVPDQRSQAEMMKDQMLDAQKQRIKELEMQIDRMKTQFAKKDEDEEEKKPIVVKGVKPLTLEEKKNIAKQ